MMFGWALADHGPDTSQGVAGLLDWTRPRERGTAMAKKAKDARSVVKLQSTESKHCYYSERNRRNMQGRLELRKYDPTLRKHVLYKEAKM
jgi:large subunit ribosomal protein L33